MIRVQFWQPPRWYPKNMGALSKVLELPTLIRWPRYLWHHSAKVLDGLCEAVPKTPGR